MKNKLYALICAIWELLKAWTERPPQEPQEWTKFTNDMNERAGKLYDNQTDGPYCQLVDDMFIAVANYYRRLQG